MGVGAGEQQAVAIKQEAVLLPQIEMAEPELLVDQRHKLVDIPEPQLAHLEIEGAGEVQRLEILPPSQGDMVLAPGPRHGERELVLRRALERPVMDRGDLLHNINGIGKMVVDSLCRSHACPLLASVEFRARNMSAANHFVNQLY